MDSAPLSPGHVMALETVAALLHDARGPWWVIAGAAVALHGGAPITVDDIDVLVSDVDVARVAASPDVRPIDAAPDDRFRSGFYAERVVAGTRIEFMADFRAYGPSGWKRILPTSRQCVRIGRATVFVPDRDEVIAMLRLFGREKDLDRIALLERGALRSNLRS